MLKPVSNLVEQLQGIMKSQEEVLATTKFDLNIERRRTCKDVYSLDARNSHFILYLS